MGNQPSAIQFQPAIDARNDKLDDARHLRYLAAEESKFIRESEQEAETARVQGHIAAAEEIEKQADIHRLRMHEHNQAAAKAIFLANNPSRESHVLLIHGLTSNEAIPLVRDHLARLYNIDSIKHIVILTGLDIIPQDVIDSFWAAAERAMRDFDVEIQCNKPSDGVIYIRFGDSNGGDNSDNLLSQDFLQSDVPHRRNDDDSAWPGMFTVSKSTEDMMNKWSGVAVGAAALFGSAAVAAMIYSRKRAEERRR
ncbi:hypothetical protein VKS41_004641 [Umbelopsis sp. WA50703]